jgi:hypothetical protein
MTAPKRKLELVEVPDSEGDEDEEEDEKENAGGRGGGPVGPKKDTPPAKRPKLANLKQQYVSHLASARRPRRVLNCANSHFVPILTLDPHRTLRF